MLEGVNRDFHGSRKVPGVVYQTECDGGAMLVVKIASVGELCIGILCQDPCAALVHLRTYGVKHKRDASVERLRDCDGDRDCDGRVARGVC